MTVAPLHATPVVGRHGARRIAAWSAAFGRPALEWQHRAAAIITDTRDDGRLRNRTAVVTVQRQAGKSAIMRSVILDRALITTVPRRIYYTAQTGKYARDFWADCVTEWSKPGSPLVGLVHAKWSQGSEVATFANGSTFSPFPPTRNALHGKQSDLVIVDEAWEHDVSTGRGLMQAIGPTQATRPDPQTLIVSAAGTVESEWFREWVDLGRAGHVPFLEYGIGDDGDPGDLDSVLAAHPAVGHTITAEYVREQAAVMPPGEFARAYGNAWTRTLERTIPAELWERARTAEPIPPGTVVLGASIAQDRSRAAIVAAGSGVLEVVESLPGTEWVASRLAGLNAREHVAGVAMLRTGPDGPVADELERLAVPFTTYTVQEYATACESWWRRLQAGALHVRPHPNHDAAAQDAARKPTGDGWVWGRRLSAGPIPELIAGTLADWLDLHRPAPLPAPRIYVGA